MDVLKMYYRRGERVSSRVNVKHGGVTFAADTVDSAARRNCNLNNPMKGQVFTAATLKPKERPGGGVNGSP